MLLRRVVIADNKTAIGVTFTTIPALMTRELLRGVLGFARMNPTTRTLFRSLWRAFFMGLSNSGLGPREDCDRPIELRIT
jgi:hypothetical protein